MHLISRLKFIGAVVVGIATTTLAAPAMAGVVYSQPPVFPSAFDAWTSSSDSPYTVYDNFTLAAPAAVTSLTWQGFNFNLGTLGNDSNPSSFTVDFYTDNSNSPGTLFGSQSIPTYESTFAGTTDLFNNGNVENVYNYSTSFAAPVSLSGGTQYWISIVGNPTYPDYWSWFEGSGGDGSSLQAGYGVRPGDRAFSLSTAPESSSLVGFATMLALGAGACFVITQKKKKSAR